MGEITILAGHRSLVANLKPGELQIKKSDGSIDWMFAGGGVLEFSPEEGCRVLADVAERVEDIQDIIEQKLMEIGRYELAQKELSEAKSEPDVAEAQAALLRAIARLRIAEKNRKLRGRR